MSASRPDIDVSAPRTRALPAALRVAVIYVLACVITTVFLAIAAAIHGRDATVGSLSMGWDAQWYWRVAVEGYPSTLPLNDAGQVSTNTWAFMPVYPMLSQFVGGFFGQYGVGAVIVALSAGYVAALAFYHLMRTRMERTAATWALVFYVCSPLAAVVHMGYAESLFLMFLFLAILAVVRRRFVWLYALIPLMGFTRPGVLAFALFLGTYGIWRWFQRRTDPLPVRQIVHIVALGALAVIIGFAWQFIAGAVTGDHDAYMKTELAWRRNWSNGVASDFAPFDGFLQATAIWFRLWGMPEVAGYVALVAAIVLIAAMLVRGPRVKELGMEVRLWSASYLFYLLLVFFPQSSIFRLLLPVSPLYGALALPRYRRWRIAVLGLGLLGQWWWIYNMLAVGNQYYQIP